MQYRQLAVRASTLDEEARTVEATIATETPVDMIDWERLEIVPEVLLSGKAKFPKNKQAPLLDSHQRLSVLSQLGSARNFVTSDGRVDARLFFSEVAADEFTKVREGHLTDVSVGYEVRKKTFVEAGKTRTIAGREFTGPVNVVTDWLVREVSITPIGADEQAKMRGVDPAEVFPRKETFAMNEELRAICVELGMDENLDDDGAQKWLVENRTKVFASAPPEPENNPPPATRRTDPPASGNGGMTDAQVRQAIQDGIREAEQNRRQQEQEFRAECDELAAIGDVSDRATELYALPDVAAVRKRINEIKSEENSNVRVSFGQRQPNERGVEAVQHSLVERCLAVACGKPETAESLFPSDTRNKDRGDFRHAGIFQMAQFCLQMDGYDRRALDRMTRDDIAIAALGFPQQAGLRANPGYHFTGSFPKITQDAINKSLTAGYQEAPATWRGPMRQGPSVSDFKTFHRIRLGTVPNVPVWDGHLPPTEVAVKDDEETGAVECRSSAISFGYKLLVNDDMDALSRIPSQYGNAFGRTVNFRAWNVITSNPTMSDGQSLFSDVTGDRKRDNLSTGSISDYTDALQTMTDLMMQMRGENTPEENESDDILAIQPVYFVGPSARRKDILQQVFSPADPNGSHSGVANIDNNLIPIIEPLLDADSTTAIYLFASPAQIDTVEIVFLQGQETPRTRTDVDFDTLAQKTIALQSFTAVALNHRGVQKHSGA